MKRLFVFLAAAASLSLVACSSSSSSDSGPVGFAKPAGTIAVNFKIDDTANHVFTNNQLKWKGAMLYDETHRTITYDSTWGGPFAGLFDDGPWDAGGHEPTGETAGDHKFGATVFVTPPTAAGTNITVGYGLIDHTFGDGWLWVGANGAFVVLANQTTDINASGQTLAAFGTVDFKLTLDTGALTPPSTGTWTTNTVTVKGTATSWNEVNVTASNASGVYTMVLSDWVGAGKTYYHSGLLKSADLPEWTWVLGGIEYKVGGACATGGVNAFTKPAGGSFAGQAVLVQDPGNKNTYIVVP